MKKKIVFIISVVVLTLSCGEGVTDSRERIIRAPQDMIWTADTIKSIQYNYNLMPRNLLVFSANDAWLVTNGDIHKGKIRHWDGKEWAHTGVSNNALNMEPYDIEGNNSNDLWACGGINDEILLAHYDGLGWTRYNTNGIKGVLYDICKDADGNLWAAGRNGLVMKYDKTKWSTDYISIPGLTPRQNDSYAVNCIEYANNKINLSITFYSNEPYRHENYFLQGDMSNWKIIDTIKNHLAPYKKNWGTTKFVKSNNKLFSFGCGGVWELKNKWEVKQPLSYCGVYGFEANDNYFLSSYQSNMLYFYDGISWKNISDRFNKIDAFFQYYSLWTNGYETFIVGHGSFGKEHKLVVWRGK
jgi:hypothetical protein